MDYPKALQDAYHRIDDMRRRIADLEHMVQDRDRRISALREESGKDEE